MPNPMLRILEGERGRLRVNGGRDERVRVRVKRRGESEAMLGYMSSSPAESRLRVKTRQPRGAIT